MIDNFEQIRGLLDFPKGEEEFYFLQIMQRRKDNPELSGNNRIIRSYYIHSLDYFDGIKDEVIQLCRAMNARAGIRLNRRSAESVAFAAMKQMITSLQQGDHRHFQRIYEKAAGQHSVKEGRTWILDFDAGHQFLEEDQMLPIGNRVRTILNAVEPEGDKVVAVIPSQTGVHVIVKPYNCAKFKWKEEVEVHKDNPTNLYIP